MYSLFAQMPHFINITAADTTWPRAPARPRPHGETHVSVNLEVEQLHPNMHMSMMSISTK